MTILHILRTSAFTTNQLTNCLTSMSEGDDLVLMDDGCYSLPHPSLNKLNRSFYIIEEHAIARAVNIDSDKIKAITLSEFLALTFNHKSTITWQQ